MPLIKNKETGDLEFSMSGEFKFGYVDQPFTLARVSAMMNEAYRAGARDALPVVEKLRAVLREFPPS